MENDPAPNPAATIPDTIEAKKELARQLIEAETPFSEVVSRTGLTEPVVRGMKGALVKRLVRDSQLPKVENAPSIESQEVDFRPIQSQTQSDSQRQTSTEGVLVKREDINAVEALLPKTAIPVWRQILSNSEKAQKLEEEKQRLQGHVTRPVSVSDSSIEDLNKKILEQKLRVKKAYADWVEEQLEQNQVTSMVEQMKNPTQKTTAGTGITDSVKQVMDIIKIAVDLSKGGSGTPNILEVYRAGKTDEQKSYSNAIRTAETNANDIALEEIKQNADLSNKRLLWEIKQYESKEAHDLKLIETAKEIVQPLLGEGLKIAGGFAKNKMAATSATNTNSVCPACNKPFYVDPSQEQVQCPNCNAVLSKNPPSQEQPSTEQRTEPKKEPISELPKAEDF